MNLFKKIASLNYKKDILPLQVLKNPDKILIVFPIDSYEVDSILPAITSLKDKFPSSIFIGITNKQDLYALGKTQLFQEFVSYDYIPRILSKRFFQLRKEIRDTKATISIDFNITNDILSWLSGATLRIGYMISPFINYRIKIKEADMPIIQHNTSKVKYSEIAQKLINILCTGH